MSTPGLPKEYQIEMVEEWNKFCAQKPEDPPSKGADSWDNLVKKAKEAKTQDLEVFCEVVLYFQFISQQFFQYSWPYIF